MSATRTKPSKRGFWRANSLTLVCFGLFLLFAVGQSLPESVSGTGPRGRSLGR